MNPKIIILVVAIAVIAVVSGAYLVLANAQPQVVVSGDNVSVYYTGSFTNGTVFDSNAGKVPLNFTVGSGMVIQGFDHAVIGMGLDQNKTVTVPVNEAYGPVNPALIVSVPANAFGNQTIKVGTMVRETANGHLVEGVVTMVNSTNVTIDFNPPLAGQTLIFTIRVVGIKK